VSAACCRTATPNMARDIELNQEMDTGYIYGLRLQDSSEYRYVGYTMKQPEERLKRHIYDARNFRPERRMPVRHWVAKHQHAVVIDVLEEIVGSLGEVQAAEVRWIASISEQHPLLNVTKGGYGGTAGIPLNKEHREAISSGLTRYYAANEAKPLSDESRRKMSAAHAGVPLSTQTRATMSDGRRKRENHPRWGATHTPESRKKMSEKLAGRSLSSEHRQAISAGNRGVPRKSAHTRHHTKQDRTSPTCTWCQKEKESK
jgi:hypothetical protein